MNTLVKYFLVITITLVSCKRTTTEITENIIEKVSKKEILKASKKINRIPEKTAITKVFNPNRNYDRAAINKLFIIRKREMHANALKLGQKQNIKNTVFLDSYTGKRLLGGNNFEYDHVRSSQYIYQKYKSILTDEEIAQVVNCRENVIATATKINRAKGKWPMEDLLANPQKIEELAININLAKQTINNAEAAIKRKVSEIILKR